MEIRFYTPQLNLIGIMENQSSILWRRKFYEPGEFEIFAPITEYNTQLCQLENLVQIEGATEAGVIEEVLYQQEDTYNKVKISGRFMSSYLDRRIIRPRMTFSGYTELAMRQLITQIQYPIPLLSLGARQGYTERVAFQATYKNVLTYMTKLSKSSNIGYRFRPNFTNKTLTFELYKGVDHSAAQNDRTRVYFNEGFQNLNSAMWQVNEQLEKNVAFVGGEGQGLDRVFVTAGNDSLRGLARREMYVNASDLRQEEMSLAQYRAALTQRGNEKLLANALATALECSATPTGNFVYREDYDLGDVVTVQKESWGVSEDKKITELLEVYENGTMIVTPTLGNALPETIDWSDQDGG